MSELVWDLGRRKSKPLKSISYTGCWTCRKRRIKCDERPGACRTCEQAKLTCAGYDVRLIWNAGPNTSRRRIRSGYKVACAPMTDDEVARALTTVEKSAIKPAAATTTAGPFSVFSSQPPEEEATENDSPVDSTSIASPLIPDSIDSGMQINDCLDEDTIEISRAPESPATQLHDTRVESTRTDLDTSSPHPSSSDSNDTASIVDDVAVSPSTRWLGHNPPEDVELILPEHNLASSIIEDTTASMLMHHYMQHVVHLMQPVSHSRNPWRTVYLPLALQGSSQLDVPRRFHSASVAVFHSVLSIAAVNLQSMRSEQEGLQQLACHHKQRALVALQSALSTKSTPYKDIMTAILSLVSADIMDGGMSDHWIHLEAGIKLQASRHYSMLVSRETCLLNNICKMLHLFGQTTLPILTPKPWPGYDHVPRGADFYSLEPSIEFLYGITTSIAGAIFTIYRLSQYVAYYRDQSPRPEQEFPATLLEACEALADALGSYTITTETFSSISPTEAEGHMVDIARAQAKAFHNAALIYYYRSIQQCSRDCLYQEQRAVLDAMNEAEELKVKSPTAGSGEQSSFPAPITWPAFVASCEAVGEERQAWDGWWRRVQGYGMRNYGQQYETVCRIWERMDENESGDWREILAGLGVRILPV
ncbi:hypothetical protein ASPVEDRAFT_46894 [Aspergillus versicolor CBS 583.65]|uniref:Zn(2)-C6 fungal-type domain-containing protein n=1 Tax=Aspergillus versicolor CBS 583.65 TaxID=1036611 RepID=A0A1L9Q1J2_ASPVE|nr:uncharacterized protein ASPVEDRAFT_46894 [Aspergillus versicolor CBS 583.65]OJJ07631.1 hypothetical protein ASPVEDRAFT_46894 [Aspergillus versicolor CBS 583.65]